MSWVDGLCVTLGFYSAVLLWLLRIASVDLKRTRASLREAKQSISDEHSIAMQWGASSTELEDENSTLRAEVERLKAEAAHWKEEAAVRISERESAGPHVRRAVISLRGALASLDRVEDMLAPVDASVDRFGAEHGPCHVGPQGDMDSREGCGE